jgi:cysteine synthase
VNEFASAVEEELVGLLNGLNINEFLFCSKDLGVGFTPLLRLPEEKNPYDEKGIPIFIKKEYLNFGESQKSRPFTMMHFYNIVSGRLTGKDTIAIATSSKFGLAAKLIVPELRRWFLQRGVEVPDVSLELYMSRKFEEEDPHMLNRLRGDGTRVVGCSNGWCPTEQSDRGQEVAVVKEIEKYLPNYRAYHQHGDSLNLLAYFLQLAPEIFYQTGGRATHYLSGTGTCGSLVGGGCRFQNVQPKDEGHRADPSEGSYAVGLEE